MGIKDSLRIDKIKQSLKLIKESIQELESIEYVLELLEKEIEDYRDLVDKESFIPKARFVKERVQRLIDRMKFAGEETLACVGIKMSVLGEIDQNDKYSITTYIATYIDRHVRPSDLLFKIDDETIGIIFPLKNRNDIEAVEQRLKFMLLNLKAKTYSSRNVLINFKLSYFFLEKDSSADEVFNKLLESLKRVEE